MIEVVITSSTPPRRPRGRLASGSGPIADPGVSVPPLGHNRLGTVLVVDDSVDAQELLRDALEAAGYAVLVARNGKQALELLVDLPAPTAIVLDQLMPVMDGLECLDVLRSYSRLARVPVVLVSAAADKRETTSAPLTKYLQKPFDDDTLRSTLAELVDRARQRRD